MSLTYTITIRKPDTKCIQRHMILSSIEDPPDLSVKEIKVYYNDTFDYTLKYDEYNFDNMSDTITKIYNHINKNTQYNINYGDIVEFPNGVFYFFHLEPVLII